MARLSWICVAAAGVLAGGPIKAAASTSVAAASPCEDGSPAALMLDGDPSTFARFTDSTPSNRHVTCSFVLDAGAEIATCGIRLVSQPDRWVTTAPAAVRVTACQDRAGRRSLVKLVEDTRLHPCFAGESQLLFWPAVTSRYYRVEVMDAGSAAVQRWGMYATWGDWYARKRMGLSVKSRAGWTSRRWSC